MTPRPRTHHGGTFSCNLCFKRKPLLGSKYRTVLCSDDPVRVCGECAKQRDGGKT